MRTEAGKRLLSDEMYNRFQSAIDDTFMWPPEEQLAAAIDAIEAEACGWHDDGDACIGAKCGNPGHPPITPMDVEREREWIEAIRSAERERIARFLPRFMQGEMFDETPENDLDLDATAFAMGERFRALIGAYPYQGDTELQSFVEHGYTCGICQWGRADRPRSLADYVAHMNAEHPFGPLLEGDPDGY